MNNAQDIHTIQAWIAKEKLPVSEGDLWSVCHPHAEQHTPGAREVFRTMLVHPDKCVRQVAIDMLGFHYRLDADELALIHTIVFNDPSKENRSGAVFVTKSQNVDAERILLEVLATDKARSVRESAFMNLLGLHGMKNEQLLELMDSMKNKRGCITVENYERILNAW
jgi:hypothetical protein